MTGVELNGSEEAPPASIPFLVRAYIAKHPVEVINAMIDYGIFQNLGYRLVRDEDR